MSKELIEGLTRFPLHSVSFILTIGIFLILVFPFDLRRISTSNGLQLPSVDCNPQNFPQNWQNVSNWVKQHFTPFIGVDYLRDYPNGLIWVILGSLPVGIVFYFLFNLFETVNHVLKCILIRIFRLVKNADKIKKEVEKGTGMENNVNFKIEEKKRIKKEVDFFNWVNTTGRGKFYDLVSALERVAVALLYGSETFFVITLFFWVLAWGTLSPVILFYSLLIWLVIGILYLLEKKKYKKDMKAIETAFENRNFSGQNINCE